MQKMILNKEFDNCLETSTVSYGDMLYDDERNQKYSLALEKAIKKRHSKGEKANVLDIGTGTGLLSMLAAQHGADSVVACEMFTPVAACAAKIIEENGFLNKIKIVNKHSTVLTVGPDGDLPFKANILVSEVFDTELIGEGAIRTFNHAHASLLEENSIVIPSVGTIYCQIVESKTLMRWNTLEDWIEGEETLVTVPERVQQCPGAPSLFDFQLSQLPRTEFVPISDPVPLFKFDFMRSKKIPTHEHQVAGIHAVNSGKAEAVFMWWDLIMDDDGDVVLSCAPVWYHPDAPSKLPSENPAKDIPWRDHWMQAVYFLREHIEVPRGATMSLRGWHDEFSLWFATCRCNYKTCSCSSIGPPACECGLHLIASRTRLACLNDPFRRSAYLDSAKALLQNKKYFIVIGDFSLLGILLARLGAIHVYLITKDSSSLTLDVYKSFIAANAVSVSVHSDLPDAVMKIESVVTSNSEAADQICIMGEPSFLTSLVPSENVSQFISAKEKFLELSANFLKREQIAIIPQIIALKACCVQFDNLWKISRPLKTCMEFNIKLFDELINDANMVQVTPGPQPLWEYPCRALSEPVTLMLIDLLSTETKKEFTVTLPSKLTEPPLMADGVVVWTEFEVAADVKISTGPREVICPGEYVKWDRYERQGVHLYDAPRLEQSITCSVEFDPVEAHFELDFED